ncbi:MAG: ADP-ribosylglycohydrolase family protein [Catenisphaera adipataccumulans]|jgi:ADP-ribosylglycohydrolase|uniref:ADP-ribosylglycohydrolase family protein n=1 Tax=Catenisphaera adipataccumulans TaxID=700500 RepID=UPI003D94F87F
MLGAIIGDICGSRFEWQNYKAKDFELFTKDCRPTDDSIMTLAVAQAILDSRPDGKDLAAHAVCSMQQLGRLYPSAGYGGRFARWLMEKDPQPYHSFGNGAAMRISAVGDAARSMVQAKQFAYAVTAVTHDHPEALKAAEAVAGSIYLARHSASKKDIRDWITASYYPLNFTLDEIRPSYTFDVSCQGSVPQALEAFFEAKDFEDTIRNAISIGGDSDTLAAIAGGLAEAYYGIPSALREQATQYLDPRLTKILKDFESYLAG